MKPETEQLIAITLGHDGLDTLSPLVLYSLLERCLATEFPEHRIQITVKSWDAVLIVIDDIDRAADVWESLRTSLPSEWPKLDPVGRFGVVVERWSLAIEDSIKESPECER